ncbi:MAG: oxygen-independent coproporphyrinogen III oxidase [bacterium]|nr:oxygen-independent coproporphyrinogen III oxidase [bacterium]
MLDAIHWDAGLIRRYDQAGPRYTSYPTAVQFHDGIGARELLQALHESRTAKRPLSLYVHLPFCAHICYYCGCNKVITQDRSRALPYLERLEREIDLISRQLDPQQTVEQLHFGGGTPTFLSHDELRRLMGHLRQRFNLRTDDGGDYGIEIDPREADVSTMTLLRELGFNRVSFGVQDIEPDVQRAVNRIQSIEQTSTLIDAARALNYRSINIDLIYGLPLQTPESFARTVAAIIKLQPDRLSVFNYAHLPERFRPQRLIKAEELPAPADKLAMLQNCIEQLGNAGYRYIGMDHFALPGDELALAQENGSMQRNFQGYTTHGHCDLIGMGVSSISQIGDLYAQNLSNLKQYEERIDAGELAVFRGLLCNEDDVIRRAVIQKLICDFRLRFADIEARFALVFRDYFAEAWPALEQMHRDGLITLGDDSIDILPAGRLMARSVCMLFDRYTAQLTTQRFSRII